MHRRRLALLLAALITAAPVAAVAQSGTVTFQNTGNGGAVVPIFSGPALTQSGILRDGFGNTANLGQLAYWTSAYSGGPAVYGNGSALGQVAEYALSTTVGTALSFSSALFGVYPDRASSIRVRLYDASFTQLFDQILNVGATSQVALNFGAISTTSGTLRMQFTEVTPQGVAAGRGAFDVGFSSLGYVVGAVTPPPPNVVPEPSTYALLGAGLTGVGAFARRRRRTAAA